VPSAPGLRPTSDRARETLFNVLAPRVNDAVFLDAFAGSGAVGIEALSRGARHAAFVEGSTRVADVLRANLQMCGLEERATVVRAAWKAAVARLVEQRMVFDIAFFDPPYDWQEAHTCLQDLRGVGLMAAEGVAILEHRAATPPRIPDGWEARRTVEVGDTSFAFFGILDGP
jgi:16S rRNA (guanine(966)-N(2))-methyltransferase RsmD